MKLEVGINTYMDLEEANTLIENELLDSDEEYSVWNSLSDDDKTKILIRSARLGESITWIGYKLNVKLLNLSWPRIINGTTTEVPYEVKLGLLLQTVKDYIDKSKNSQYNNLKEQGVKTYTIKGASITFSDTNSSKVNGINHDIYNQYFSKWSY